MSFRALTLARPLVTLALVALVLAACAPRRAAVETATRTAQPTPAHGATVLPAATGTPTPTPLAVTPAPADTTGPATPGADQAAINLARQRLAEKLGVPQDQIVVVSSEAVQWTNTGLGCPAAGEHVLMVIVPGYRLRFRCGEQEYEYHTGGTILPRLCPAVTTSATEALPLRSGDVLILQGEMVSIGNMPFTRLALSLPNGETFEIKPSSLAEQVAAQPRELKRWRVRVAGRGLLTPIELELLGEAGA